MLNFFIENEKTAENIIFLDIDGVLFDRKDKYHSEDYIKVYQDKLGYLKAKLGDDYEKLSKYDIGAALLWDKNAVQKLFSLCQTHNAKIVVISTWRIAWKHEQSMFKLKTLFKLWDLDQFLIDEAPIDSERHLEIKSWLENTKYKINSYVIFDDKDVELSNTFNDNFIHVDSHILLSDEDIEKAKEIFKQPAVLVENTITC